MDRRVIGDDEIEAIVEISASADDIFKTNLNLTKFT
jgi:hypothetical protein